MLMRFPKPIKRNSNPELGKFQISFDGTYRGFGWKTLTCLLVTFTKAVFSILKINLRHHLRVLIIKTMTSSQRAEPTMKNVT